MIITEKRIKEIILEEKNNVLEEKTKINGAQGALQEIALQSALMYDSTEKLVEINEVDLKKIKLIAEELDSIFYRLMNA